MKEFFKVTNLKQVIKYADDFLPVETEEIDLLKEFLALTLFQMLICRIL
jgi:hypothetical protein